VLIFIYLYGILVYDLLYKVKISLKYFNLFNLCILDKKNRLVKKNFKVMKEVLSLSTYLSFGFSVLLVNSIDF